METTTMVGFRVEDNILGQWKRKWKLRRWGYIGLYDPGYDELFFEVHLLYKRDCIEQKRLMYERPSKISPPWIMYCLKEMFIEHLAGRMNIICVLYLFRTPKSARNIPWSLVVINMGTTWTPKVCRIMAFRAVIMGLGLLFYILLGFRY